MARFTLSLVSVALLVGLASAGTGYEVTSTTSDGKAITYEVNFGGGMMFHQYTAFDPVSKEFVYLTWPRDGRAPRAVSVIWNHHTGETMPLYRFPKVRHPLPVIPSIEAMKVCPKTGDPNFKAEPRIAYD